MNSKIRIRPLLILVVAIVTGCGLSGCDKKTAAAAPSQLAAKMGDEEVTLHEVDRIVAQQSNPAGTDPEANRKHVVDALIDQHLMAAEAVKLKLDHSPDVVSDETSCRLSALQRGYVHSVVEQQADSNQWSNAAAQTYYDEHPELFAQRQVFLVREVIFPKNKEISPDGVDKLSTADLTALLEQHDINYRLTYGLVAADALPPDLLAAVGGLDNGHSKTLQISSDVIVLTRISASASPVDFATAESGIVNYLQSKAVTQRVQDQIAMLRTGAPVQYLNEFASAPVASNSGPSVVER